MALTVAAAFLGAGCPLSKATYVLRSSGQDWLRIGTAADGETVLRFALGKRETQLPLAQVQERVGLDYLDGKGRPVPLDPDNAPAFIRTRGLANVSDAPDGEWRLAWCAK